LFLLLMAAYLVLVERKLLGRLQVRYGPNRAGKYGLLQPFADTIKMMTKEDTVPDAADRVIFLLAPAVVAITALLMFAVIPFGPDITVYGHRVPLVVTDLNVGLLFVFARLPRVAARPRLGSTWHSCWAASAAQPRWSAAASLGLSLSRSPEAPSARPDRQRQAERPFILIEPLALRPSSAPWPRSSAYLRPA
jgi:NADH-quinone oxidoreductase subunit H